MKKDQLWDDTSSMKKDWLCRGSYDENNQEIAPVMMPSDDLDQVMMIQIEWWSRSRWIWRELDDDLDDIEKNICVDKLFLENTFLVKR